MAETYLIGLDMEQLRAHRSQLEQRQLSEQDVLLWLVNYGFYPRPDGLYLAEDALLEHLEPTAIRSLELVIDRPAQ